MGPPGVVLGTSWSLLGRSWGGLGASRAPLGGLLGALEGLLGALGGPLGRSWGGLGASRAALGGVLGRLGCLLGRLGGDAKQLKDDRPRKSEFQTLLGGHCASFWRSFWKPKSVKMASKTNQNLRRFSRAKKLLFKSLLEPSWAKTNVQKSVPTVRIRENNEDAFFINLGPTWPAKVPKMTPR